MLFWAIAAALTAGALLFLLPPLLRTRSTPPEKRVATNAAIYREQLEELNAEIQRGTITAEEFARASRDVERRIVAEFGDTAAPQPAERRPLRAAALAVGLLLPLAAVLGYALLGEPRGLNAESAQAPDPNQMESLVARLAAHVEKNPQDAEGWALLARAQVSLERFELGALAYARALQLTPDNRDLLVELIKTLAHAGRVAFETGNYAGAIGYWERILPFAPPGSEFAQNVNDSIAEARQLGGIAPAAASASSLQGVVTLAPALRGKVAPGDTVFVLARAVEGKPGGSRMPLAVVRTTVDKLPYKFMLDDSMAMAPTARLSGHAKVVVTARISKSGNPAPQKGDIEGISEPVAPGKSGLHVVMSRVVD